MQPPYEALLLLRTLREIEFAYTKAPADKGRSEKQRESEDIVTLFV